MHVLFDLDGTLTDSRAGIVRCIQHALLAMGRAAPPEPELTMHVGPPLSAVFATLLATADQGSIDRAIACYRERYEDIGIFENVVYPGIPDALSDLVSAGHTLALVTAKPHVYARRILEHLAL